MGADLAQPVLRRSLPATFGQGHSSIEVVLEAFVPDLAAPDRPFRPGLRVKGVAAHPGVFEMTRDIPPPDP